MPNCNNCEHFSQLLTSFHCSKLGQDITGADATNPPCERTRSETPESEYSKAQAKILGGVSLPAPVIRVSDCANADDVANQLRGTIEKMNKAGLTGDTPVCDIIGRDRMEEILENAADAGLIVKDHEYYLEPAAGMIEVENKFVFSDETIEKMNKAGLAGEEVGRKLREEVSLLKASHPVFEDVDEDELSEKLHPIDGINYSVEFDSFEERFKRVTDELRTLTCEDVDYSTDKVKCILMKHGFCADIRFDLVNRSISIDGIVDISAIEGLTTEMKFSVGPTEEPGTENSLRDWRDKVYDQSCGEYVFAQVEQRVDERLDGLGVDDE